MMADSPFASSSYFNAPDLRIFDFILKMAQRVARQSSILFTEGFRLWLARHYPCVSVRLDALAIQERELEFWIDAAGRMASVFEEARMSEREGLAKLRDVEKKMMAIQMAFVDRYVQWVNWQFASAHY